MFKLKHIFKVMEFFFNVCNIFNHFNLWVDENMFLHRVNKLAVETPNIGINISRDLWQWTWDFFTALGVALLNLLNRCWDCHRVDFGQEVGDCVRVAHMDVVDGGSSSRENQAPLQQAAGCGRPFLLHLVETDLQENFESIVKPDLQHAMILECGIGVRTLFWTFLVFRAWFMRSNWVKIALRAPSHFPGPIRRYWYAVTGPHRTRWNSG